jgi:hypothetical protein
MATRANLTGMQYFQKEEIKHKEIKKEFFKNLERLLKENENQFYNNESLKLSEFFASLEEFDYLYVFFDWINFINTGKQVICFYPSSALDGNVFLSTYHVCVKNKGVNPTCSYVNPTYYIVNDINIYLDQVLDATFEKYKIKNTLLKDDNTLITVSNRRVIEKIGETAIVTVIDRDVGTYNCLCLFSRLDDRLIYNFLFKLYGLNLSHLFLAGLGSGGCSDFANSAFGNAHCNMPLEPNLSIFNYPQWLFADFPAQTKLSGYELLGGPFQSSTYLDFAERSNLYKKI